MQCAFRLSVTLRDATYAAGLHNPRAISLRLIGALAPRSGPGASMRGSRVAACGVRRGAWHVASVRRFGGPPDADQDTATILAGPGAGPAAGSVPIHLRATSAQRRRMLLFSSTDLWRHGGFAHRRPLLAPAGSTARPVLKLMFGGGIYRYLSGALGNAEVAGHACSPLAILPGWRFVRDNLIVTVFAGIDFQHHRLTPDDPSAGCAAALCRQRRAASSSGTSRTAHDGRGRCIGLHRRAELQRAAGHRAARVRRFYLGPEVQASRRRQLPAVPRRPARHRASRSARFEWSAAPAGPPTARHRSGAYGKLGVFIQKRDSSVERAAEARHRDRHRDQHQPGQRQRIVVQVGERRALEHDRAHDADVMRERQRIR